MTGNVLVMAKAPSCLSVKSRLAPAFGTRDRAVLQRALLRHTTAAALAVAPASTFVVVEPPEALREVASLAPSSAHVLAQRGTDLGSRMAAAVVDVATARAGPILVIGTDIPLLGPRHLEVAFQLLSDAAEVVFGPTTDGGYYLVGLRRPTSTLSVFDIDPGLWGGPEVLATSRRHLAAGMRVRYLEELRDLDTPADAAALLAEPALADGVRSLLRRGVETTPVGEIRA